MKFTIYDLRLARCRVLLARPSVLFSLTPCFSWGFMDVGNSQPFQRFLVAPGKPLKRFGFIATLGTHLKQGVNERILADRKS